MDDILWDFLQLSYFGSYECYSNITIWPMRIFIGLVLEFGMSTAQGKGKA